VPTSPEASGASAARRERPGGGPTLSKVSGTELAVELTVGLA